MLTSAEFSTLGQRFATCSAGRSPSWAWINTDRDACNGPFCAPVGYLRSSPIMVPAHSCPNEHAQLRRSAGNAEAAVLLGVEATCEGDDSTTISPDMAAGRLDLHIVHSESYRVPVLLLQGHHPGGAPWSPDALRAFLASQRHLGAAHEQSEGRLAPLSGSVVTQMEHPVLRIPCCCVDPCETAALMATVLGASVDGRGERLDYISAWWSILAPLVGAASRSEWYARSPS